MERWATFDCYGTLIDWEQGIGVVLSALWPDEDREGLLARFHEIEPKVQEEASLAYREVLAEVVRRIAGDERFPLQPGYEDALSASLSEWPPFPEVPASLARLQQRGWRLGILSNVDPDLLEHSIRQLGVKPDLTVTVAEAGSYKPALGHWERFRELTQPEPGRHIHVAASLFHDIAPCADLGIPAVWINRTAEITNLPRAAELPDLEELPPTLDRLVTP